MRTPLLTATCVVALAFSLAGCTVPAQVRPTTSASPAASAPEPEVTQDATPALITSYEALPWQAFNALPSQDRLQYVDYRIDSGRGEHAQLLGAARPGFVAPSASSNPQQIVDHFVYVLDEADYQFRIDPQTGAQLHDATEGIKYLSGAFLRVEGEGLSTIFDAELEAHRSNAAGPPYTTDTRFTATAYAAKTVESNGTIINYQDITFTTDDGSEYVGRWVLIPFVAVDGTEKSTWLLDQTYFPDQPIEDY
jgi:hypothetical protein